ncbi:DUF4400 domain-containing protein [Enterobacter sp. RHBSTW-00994]|uniref:DUF4400 domain-containing protein n=1 Tax=Enterobacter sp. RHBSTW-00994 TaxID=2742676 RepID=UPI0015EA80D2|nr:DUF4400 domain-containing protein [Enterobacter sp. RHBSTW-00994]QLR41632.1 DUF4400 domain-containing protein [Enterobacter sp. RHBSTW-00994]
MSEQRPPPSHPPQGPIGWLLSLTGRLIGLVIGALMLRVVLEIGGLYFWWPQEGSRHVFQVMKREQAELVSALQPHPLRDEIVMLLEKGTTRVLMVNRLLQKPFTALVYTLVSFMQRLIWLIIMLPLFCLCTIAAIVEGLVLRDLRRFGGGYESSSMFYWILRLSFPFKHTGVLCYLALPTSLSQFWLLLLIISAGIMYMATIFNLKKYI